MSKKSIQIFRSISAVLALCGTAFFIFPFNFLSRNIEAKTTIESQTPPAWVKDEYEDAAFLNFLIHLAPLAEEIPLPEFEPDGCILWKYRKPERCPRGIRI